MKERYNMLNFVCGVAVGAILLLIFAILAASGRDD